MGQGLKFGVRVAARAAQGGQLETLKWLREAGCPWDGITTQCAAQEGHIGVGGESRVSHECPQML